MTYNQYYENFVKHDEHAKLSKLHQISYVWIDYKNNIKFGISDHLDDC